MRILLATDASASARLAVDFVAERRWAPGSRIRLLAVDDAFGADRDELQTELSRAAERLAGAHLEVETELLAGRAASTLLDAAEQWPADLAVVGNRGRGRIASVLLGSVSAELLERARCSVLVVRGAAADRLLVGVDGSASSLRVPPLLCASEAFAGVPALVVSVSRDREPWPPTLDLRAARAATRAAQQLISCGISAEREVLVGEPAAAILDRAAAIDAQLLAVGSRGITGLRRVLLGSVARNVALYAPCSVVVARRLTGR